MKSSTEFLEREREVWILAENKLMVAKSCLFDFWSAY